MFKIILGSRRTLLVAAAACVLGSLTILSNVGLLATSAWLISAAALHPPVAELSVAIVGVRFFGLSRAVCRYLERYLSHDVTFRLLADIRVWLYGVLEPLAPVGLAKLGKGDIFSRLVADVETLKYFYLRALFPAFIAVLAVAATVGLVAWLAPPLAWPVTGALLAAGCGIPAVIGWLEGVAGRGVVDARSRLNGCLADSIEGVTELAAFGQADAQAAKVAAVNARFIACQTRSNAITSLADALGALSMNLTVIAVIALAAPLVTGGGLAGIYLAVIALAIQAGFEAILPLPAVVYYVKESAAAMGRLAAVAGMPPGVSHSGVETVSTSCIELSARDLSFTYQPDLPPALTGISFDLPPGKRLAIVGPSGAGKSSLAGLILRFWDYTAGSLCINRRGVRSYPPEEVRRLFSVVSQDTYLFNATIRDNILLAKPDATPVELAAAVTGAMLDEFIDRLPQGLETATGQNGLALSGGERQRIALARALLKGAPVWLLDEPTAGLDAKAEGIVMENILYAAGARAVILITHRLTGLEAMDEIIVLDRGCIAERGTLPELLTAKGMFYHLWRLQHDLVNSA
ncbi:Putative multidrug export ATP-binding/permease protein [Sporomusa carbonis]|uniref:thiol reductant ABC exporter subunit CydC n=1 Tax=Sporomusa carbonis TaxID=3076075 RepID=UPI003A78549A